MLWPKVLLAPAPMQAAWQMVRQCDARQWPLGDVACIKDEQATFTCCTVVHGGNHPPIVFSARVAGRGGWTWHKQWLKAEAAISRAPELRGHVRFLIDAVQAGVCGASCGVQGQLGNSLRAAEVCVRVLQTT